jgi:hypothetical protein
MAAALVHEVELAGLELATSNNVIYRDFIELNSVHESDVTRSAFYGGVAYGLQDSLSVNATLTRKSP